MSKFKIIKDIGLITFSQFLTSFGSFLLLPIITKSLGSYDYGTWTQILVTVSLLSSIAIMGLSMGIIRFLSGENDKQKIRDIYYSVVFIVIFSGIFVSSILYFASDFLAYNAFNDIKTSYYIKYASPIVFFMSLEYIVLFYFRIFNQVQTFAKLTIFKSLSHLIFTIILLHFGLGLLSIIISYLVIESILAISSFYLIISQIGFSIPNFREVEEVVRYSLPLTPNSLIKWITDSSDKYLITYFLGLSASGIYSAAYSVASLVNFIIYPIQFILFPELSKLYNNGEYEQAKNYIGLSLKYFLFIAIPAVAGISFLSKPLLIILTTSEFANGSNVIPFVALAVLLAGVFQIIINITHLVKKTKFNFYIFLFGAISNLILNIIIIPYYGIVGAGFATLISYILMVIICAKYSFQFLKPKIDWTFIVKCLFSAGIMCSILIFLPSNTLIYLAINVVIGAIVYLISILILKSFSDEETQLVKTLISKKTGR